MSQAQMNVNELHCGSRLREVICDLILLQVFYETLQ